MRQIVLLLLLSISSFIFAQNPPTVFFAGGNICETEPFKLVFFDEFHGTELNTSKWTTYFPDGPDGTDQCSFCRTHSTLDNQEGQIYRDENVRLSDGNLYLDVKQQAGTWYEFNKKYTSGMIQSIQTFNTYTKYEIRCKISSGDGYWPAFWAFGWNTEIDVFEFYEDNHKFECSVHYWDNYYPNFLGLSLPSWMLDLNIKQFKEFVDPGINLSEDFHIYSVEYDKFFVNFYLDGEKVVSMPRYFKIDGSAVTSCNVPPGTYIQHPEFPQYGNPLNVIANVALYNEPANQLQIVPKTMEIDYIRVYQRNPQIGLSDLCNSFKINGSSSLCLSENKKDTLIYCFDGPYDARNQFTTTNNIDITQNPAFDLSKIDTTIIIDGVLKDTFYYDTTYHFGCVRITPKSNAQDGIGSISITTNNESCGLKTFTLPLQIGIPTPNINLRLNDPCSGLLILRIPNYNINLIEFEIYNKGNLISSPNIIDISHDGVYISLPKQRVFENSYFYIKMTITSKCGEKEVITKIDIPKSTCRNIEYIVSSNPSNGLVSIQLLDSDMMNDIYKIYVTNSITNNLVFINDNIISMDDLNIDLNHLPNGNYIISVENTDNQLFSKTVQLLK